VLEVAGNASRQFAQFLHEAPQFPFQLLTVLGQPVRVAAWLERHGGEHPSVPVSQPIFGELIDLVEIGDRRVASPEGAPTASPSVSQTAQRLQKRLLAGFELFATLKNTLFKVGHT